MPEPRDPDAERLDEELDDELDGTFPASDPPGVTQPRPHPFRDPGQEHLKET